jgi:hypothetical protein
MRPGAKHCKRPPRSSPASGHPTPARATGVTSPAGFSSAPARPSTRMSASGARTSRCTYDSSSSRTRRWRTRPCGGGSPQVRRDPTQPAHARGDRPGVGREDRWPAAAQPLGQPHATPQRSRHRHPSRTIDRGHPPRDTACAAPLVHHHRTASGRAAARDVARRPPHPSRHDRGLRPVRPIVPPRPDLRAHDRHRTLTTSTDHGSAGAVQWFEPLPSLPGCGCHQGSR